MAGRIFEVRGRADFASVPVPTCPPALRGKTVTVKSKDGFLSKITAEAATLSATIWDIIAKDGPEETIALPVKSVTINKVIEYLNYHKDYPCAELHTPLSHDNLVDCGVSKWDSQFVGVDKDVLYDLILAASFLRIDSLFFLAAAKATLLYKGKDAKKLRKEADLENDLPGDEEDAVLETVARDAAVNSPESFALNAAALATVTQAADRNGVLEATMEQGTYQVSIKSYRHATWRVACLQDWKALSSAPTEVCKDRDLIMACIGASHGRALQYASPSLLEDRDLVLEAVKHSAAALQEAHQSLKGDRDFVLKCLVANGEALAFAAMPLRQDRDLILEAAKQGAGSALQGAQSSMKDDAGFVLQLVRVSPEAYKYASAELQKSRDFALKAAASNGLSLRHMPPAFTFDRQVVANAVRQNNEAVIYSHTTCREDMDLVLPYDTNLDHALKEKAEKRKPPKPYNGPWMFLHEDGKGQWICEYQCSNRCQNVGRMVQYSASSTMTANMGQGNYICANSFLDKMPFYERPEKWSVTVMWGAVVGMGMRLKAFGSQDFMNNSEGSTSIEEAKMMMRATMTRCDLPEWYNEQMMDPVSREYYLALTAGGGTGGGWKPGETQEPPPHTKPLAGVSKKDGDGRDDAERAESKCPLDGWPSLGARPDAPAPMAYVEGAHVKLVGMKSKTGKTGVLVKLCGNGRWKVKLDNDDGTATLKQEYLELIDPSEVPPPRSQAQDTPAQEAVQQAVKKADYSIVGTWDGWAEPREMTWDRGGKFYKAKIRLTYNYESFQILLGESWETCLHPPSQTNGCPQSDYATAGPDRKGSCRGLHWTVGKHPGDEGVRGNQYEVRLSPDRNGNASKVSWVKL